MVAEVKGEYGGQKGERYGGTATIRSKRKGA